MRSIKPYLSIFFFSAILLFSFCDSNDSIDQLTEEEMQLNLLAKTWSLGTATYEGDDVTDRFNGFTVTFTKTKSYSSTPDRGGYDFEPFKTSGTWDFKDGNLNLIERNDDVEMDIIVSSSSLKMSFLIAESNGRLAGLGEYQFDLVSQ